LNTQLDIHFNRDKFRLEIGADCFGPETEVRTLEAVRQSLRDPNATGPAQLYAIVMDVGRHNDRQVLLEAMLLFGVVAYAAGTIGDEPVRSQGHIHAVSPHSGWSPPELFEIWTGTAIIFMQEAVADEAGRCFAVTAQAGERVLVPPGWAHMVINGNVNQEMVFGAVCDRGYAGFEYRQVRQYGGLAFFPIVQKNGVIRWERNPRYKQATLIEKTAGIPASLMPTSDVALYDQAVTQPASFAFVPYPATSREAWENFVP
jgi:glucose-6-phosphate isomerase